MGAQSFLIAKPVVFEEKSSLQSVKSEFMKKRAFSSIENSRDTEIDSSFYSSEASIPSPEKIIKKTLSLNYKMLKIDPIVALNIMSLTSQRERLLKQRTPSKLENYRKVYQMSQEEITRRFNIPSPDDKILAKRDEALFVRTE